MCLGLGWAVGWGGLGWDTRRGIGADAGEGQSAITEMVATQITVSTKATRHHYRTAIAVPMHPVWPLPNEIAVAFESSPHAREMHAWRRTELPPVW